MLQAFIVIPWNFLPKSPEQKICYFERPPPHYMFDIFLKFCLAYFLTAFLAYLLALYLVCLLAFYLAYLLSGRGRCHLLPGAPGNINHFYIVCSGSLSGILSAILSNVSSGALSGLSSRGSLCFPALWVPSATILADFLAFFWHSI